MTQSLPAHFDVHPSVVFKLGEDLITDDIQALAELVKNSYDADATHVVVRIDTRFVDEAGAIGRIEVVDNGVGMTPKGLQRGWLTISDSRKRDMKAKGLTTGRGRTPLGDKGLGRLGAQRLGDRLAIVTSTGDGTSHRMDFSWSDFAGRDSLREVPVFISSVRDGRREAGTTITITGLNDPDILADRSRVQSEIAKTITPYREIEKFRLFVTVNGESLDLSALDRRVRDASTVRYDLKFDGTTLRIHGRVKLAQLRPNAKADRETWARVAEADGGHGLLSYLSAQPQASTWKLRPARSKKWWLELSHEVELEGVRPKLDDTGAPANPGPFSGEIDSFNLAAGSVQEVGVFSRVSDLRSLLREQHGIRVYRDGFNVRAPEDWLGIGKQITSGGSWYGLRPATTMGYVAITAAGNAQLTETTDREGFIRTPAYLSFEALLKEFIDITAEVQEFIGRGAVAYRRQFAIDEETTSKSTETVLEELTKALEQAEAYVAPMRSISHELMVSASVADELLDKYAAESAGQPREREILEVINRLSRQATKASEFVDSLEGFVRQVSEQRVAAKKVQADLETMSEQLTLTYETMAVGLTAEALAHEIGNIAERLARRSTEIRRVVRERYPDDARMLRYVEQVQGVVAGLRRQLAHLAPSLRYVRERRETMRVSRVLSEISEYYKERWNKSIAISVTVGDDFDVVMNRGKLLQVIDNLVLNSEYWLLEQVRLGNLENPAVTIVARPPGITIADNGRGIDPQVEDSLFEPFVSKKPRGLGRGLGLFIVRQLLEAEGCEIFLQQRRNRHGRRYSFELDLTSVMSDE